MQNPNAGIVGLKLVPRGWFLLPEKKLAPWIPFRVELLMCWVRPWGYNVVRGKITSHPTILIAEPSVIPSVSFAKVTDKEVNLFFAIRTPGCWARTKASQVDRSSEPPLPQSRDLLFLAAYRIPPVKFLLTPSA